MTDKPGNVSSTSRREFLAASSAAAITTLTLPHGVHADGSDLLKVGLIGCGGQHRLIPPGSE